MKPVLRDLSFRYDMMQADQSAGLRGSSKPSKAASLLAVGSTQAWEQDILTALISQGSSTSEVLPLDIAAHMLEQSSKADGSFVQQPAVAKEGSYQSQSGAIFGILNQMKDEFEANLSAEQKAEMQ